MIGARVLACDDDEVGGIEVVDRDRALADADGTGQRGAGGFVAHVRAVRQIIGAVAAYQQLIQERGLVGSAPRGVEKRLVRSRQGTQLLRDQLVGVGPFDGGVVGGAGAQHHRMGEPALLTEPVARLVGQLLDGVRGEEFGGDGAQRRLFGDRLRAVLAELCRATMAGRLGPGTAGTIETVYLVDPGQRAGGADHAHLLDRAFERDGDGRDPGRLLLRCGHAQRGLVDVACRPITVHGRHCPLRREAVSAGPRSACPIVRTRRRSAPQPGHARRPGCVRVT